MLETCPNHQYSTNTLVEYFVNSLSTTDCTLLNAAIIRCIYKMDEEWAWNLIKTIALNKQHMSQRDVQALQGVRIVGHDPLLEKLASDMDKLTIKLDQLHASMSTPPPQSLPSLTWVAPSYTFCN